MQERLAGWIAEARERVAPGLSLPEIRKAVQAVSALYVERRPSAGLGAKSTESAGKRAAFATYYAPLHLLIAWRGAQELRAETLRGIRRLHDLGCGTGAAGVGAALACAEATGGALPEILGVDRSGWALAEARHTFGAFGCRGRTRRAEIPGAFPRLASGDAIVLGWAANELSQEARVALLGRLEEALRRDHPVLVIEPLARGIAPWWPTWARALGAHGVGEREIRFTTALPEWVEKLDLASGLDHSELRARAFVSPAPATASPAKEAPTQTGSEAARPR